MKVYYLGVIRAKKDEPTVELCAEQDLSEFSRFTRGEFGKFMTVFSKTIAERTKPGSRQAIEEQGYTFHAYTRAVDGRPLAAPVESAPAGTITAVMITKDYVPLKAQAFLSKALDDFLVKHSAEIGLDSVSYPELKKLLEDAKDPENTPIAKIQQELDETKIVLHKTIESVLQRGEKIDDLVAKSSDLSDQSKMFYRQAKKQNSCCTVM